MRQSGDGSRLAFESGSAAGSSARLSGSTLIGDVPRQTRVARPVDLSHSSGAERARGSRRGRGVCPGKDSEALLRSGILSFVPEFA